MYLALREKIFNNFTKKVGGYFLLLLFIQAVNYLFPIIIGRELLKIYGSTFYGKYASYMSLIGYFSTLISFGFLLSGTSEVAILNQSKDEIGLKQLINNSFLIKFVLTLVSILFFLLAYQLSKNDISFLLPGVIYICSYLFLYDWVLHGLQDLKKLLIITLLSRIIGLVSIFLCTALLDSYYFLLVDSLTQLLFGISTFYSIRNYTSRYFFFFSRNTLKDVFKNNLYSFLTTISTYFYTTGSLFILSLLESSDVVASFSISERLIFLVNGGLSVLNRAAFPILSKSYSKYGKEKLLKEIFLIIVFYLIIGLILVIIFFFFLDNFAGFLYIDKKSINIIKFLSFTFAYIPTGAIVSLTLIILKRFKEVLYTNLSIAVINIFTSYFTTKLFGVYGFALNYCIMSFLPGVIQMFVLLRILKK